MNWKKIHGLIQGVISLCWISWYGHLWYLYHFTDSLFLIMLPDWLLVMHMGLAGYSVFLCYKTFKGQLKFWIGYLYLLVGLAVGIGVELFFIS